jgi:tRNA nucleotidyltransferase (CCA-adding enzyme)
MPASVEDTTVEITRTRTDDVLVELFGPRVFLIGGPVRDILRQRFHGGTLEPKDNDYVIVGASFDEVVSALKPFGKIDAVGASFGVLKVTVEGEETVDVALPRRERSTGWGHKEFEIQSGPEITIEEDQERRDFRMNAVGVQLSTGRVVGYPGAIEDIRDRKIVAIAGKQSFVDDPLRILRAAQFAARFGFDISPSTFEDMKETAHLVATVSPERIAEEMTKLLTRSETPSRGIRIMHETGVLPHVIPGMSEAAGVIQNDFHAYDVFDHCLAVLDQSRPDLEARWAALLHDIGKPPTRSTEKVGYGYTFYDHEVVGATMARDVLARLRYPTALIERVQRLVAHHMYAPDPALTDAAVRRFINRVGPDLLEALFHLRECDKKGSGLPHAESAARNAAFQARVHAMLETKPALAVSDLAVNGNDVTSMLVEMLQKPAREIRGPIIGTILTSLKEMVIEDPSMNDRDRLLEEMRNIAAAETGADAVPAALRF